MTWNETSKIKEELTFGKGTVTPEVIKVIVQALERMQREIDEIKRILPNDYSV